MDHSALDYVIDQNGVVRFALQYDESAKDSAEDLKRLLQALPQGKRPIRRTLSPFH
jgi:cytochrome oxidase Cu insertion factor (SCO1/SenC/PrrC family)